MHTLRLALLAVLGAAAPAAADPIFADNFDAQNGGTPAVPFSAFSGWTVTAGTVDLIGSGPGGTAFDLIPGNGLYVDLDGSTSQPGLFATAMSFGPGTYLVEFALGGSHRSSTETVTVSLGSWSETFTLNDNDPFTTISRTVGTTGGQLRFQNGTDASPNVGALLNNVSVSAATAIPEPATLAVVGGVALAGAFGYRRRTAPTAG